MQHFKAALSDLLACDRVKQRSSHSKPYLVVTPLHKLHNSTDSNAGHRGAISPS